MTNFPPHGGGGPTAPSARATSPLSLKEISEAYSKSDRYGPILTLKEAAELSHYAPTTLKRKASEDFFKGCISRGKPLLFWRDRFLLRIWNKK